MGNNLEKNSGVVKVSDGIAIQEENPILSEINRIKCVLFRQDAPILTDFNLYSKSFDEIKNHLISLHRFKVQVALQRQDLVIKKCESLDNMTNITLQDRLGSFAVRLKLVTQQ